MKHETDIQKIIADIKATKGSRKGCQGLHSSLQSDGYITSICKWTHATSPARIDALIEALEKEQRYIERLREWNAGLAQESCERQQRIDELESQRKLAFAASNRWADKFREAEQRIAELQEINAQVIHSRDHYKHISEELMRRIHELQSRAEAAEKCLSNLAAVSRRYLPDYDEHPEIQAADDLLEQNSLVTAGIQIQGGD